MSDNSQAKDSFFSGSVDELKKVTHPTKEETIRASIVTVAFVVFFALILALCDIVARYLTSFLVA